MRERDLRGAAHRDKAWPARHAPGVRIVSLCPSTTESIIVLGRAEALVGRTKFCIHPADVVAGIEKVGGTKSPKIDRILALEPNLVLLNEEENRRADHDALAPHVRVEVSFPKTVGEVPDHLRWLGRLIDAEGEANVQAAALEAALEDLDGVRAARPKARFRYAYLIWRGPFMAAGAPTYVDDLLGRAGGVNVCAELGRYPEVELERLDPDVVLLPDEPFPFAEAHIPEIRALQPSARVELLPGDDCCWHGTRSLQGVQLAQALFARLAR